MKKQEIMERGWDYLIVLDACRYDDFEELYSDYLGGELEKRKSRGSSTLDWLANTFNKELDLTYFSSNPYINSKGISLNESKWGSSCGYDWSATDHFKEIIDIWDFGWDKELGTVHPKEVNDAVISRKENGGRDGRAIIHYMQPHAPFISNGEARKLKRIRKGFRKKEKKNGVSKLSKTLRSKFESTFSDKELSMKMSMLMNLSVDEIINSVKNNETKSRLRRYYKENLELVLQNVSELIKELDGEIIVTADHGEAFGEQGVWEHHVETPIPPLIEVPWLKIN